MKNALKMHLLLCRKNTIAKIPHRHFFGKSQTSKNENEDLDEANYNFQVNLIDFPDKELKAQHLSQKTFDRFAKIFAEQHPNITEKLTKEFSALSKDREEANNIRKELARLEEVNKINEEKLTLAENAIAQQEKEAEEVHGRLLKEKEKEKIFAISKFAKEILEVLDNLERSLTTLDKTTEGRVGPAKERIKTAHEKSLAILEKFSVKKMEGVVGNKVDPNFHDIIAFIPVPGKAEEEVLDVTASGYMIGERVLRPAKVVVVKNN